MSGAVRPKILLAKRMKAIQLKSYVTSMEQLAVCEVDIPSLTNDQVLVQIHSASANFFDILQVQGKYQTQPPFPWNAGFEFAVLCNS
jgi:NADPH2:quinone reductase